MDTNSESWVNEKMAALDEVRGQEVDIDHGYVRLQDRHQRTAKRRGRVTFATVAASTSLVFAMALPAPRAVAQRCWQSFCAVEANFLSTKDRKKAPDFTLRDAMGKNVKLSDYRGKIVLLDFWATDCGGCRVEIPWFVEFQQAYRDRGFVVLGLSLDDAGWTVVKPFIEEKRINYEVMISTDDVTNRYHIESMPTTLIIDKSGRIASTHVGLGKKEEFRDEIEALLNK
jgi:peroxiredoxin